MRKIFESLVKWQWAFIALGLAGCATPFDRRAHGPSPADTMVKRAQPDEFSMASQRPFAAPRRPEPEPEEILIFEPEVAKSHEEKPIAAEYVVRKGDCLSWIAKKFKIPLKDLLNANGLGQNAKLSVGQKLALPGISPDQMSAMSSGPQEYTVRKGDCLSVIASKYGVSSREIRVANGMKSDRIIAGKKLIIPERGRYAGHKDKTGSKPESTKKEKNFEVDTNGYYTIRKGDSLSKIALKAKVSVRELQAWNNISDSAKIQVGEKILVKNKAVISADFVKKEPTIPSLLLPHDNPQNDADFFGTIDEIPVVQVRD